MEPINDLSHHPLDTGIQKELSVVNFASGNEVKPEVLCVLVASIRSQLDLILCYVCKHLSTGASDATKTALALQKGSDANNHTDIVFEIARTLILTMIRDNFC